MMLLDRLEKHIAPELIKNYFIYSFGAIALGLVQFLLLPIFTTAFSPSVFGRMELINTLMNFFGMFIMFGLTSILSVDYYKHDLNGRKKLVSDIYKIYILFGTPAVAIAMVVFVNLRNNIFGGNIRPEPIIFAFTALFFSMFMNIYLGVLNISKQAVKNSIGRTFIGVASLGLTPFFIYVAGMGIESYFLSLMLAYFTVAITGWFALGRHFGGWSYDFRKLGFFSIDIRRYLSHGFPFMVSMISIYAIMNLDKWIILSLLNPHDVGIYSTAFRFGMGYDGLISAPVLLAYTPHIFEKYSKGEYKQNLIIISFIVFVIFSVFSAVTPFVAKYLITPKYYGALNLIPVIIFGFMVYLLSQFYFMPLKYHKKSKIILGNTMIALAVHFVLNVVLVKSYGVSGSAYAFLFSNIIWALLSLIQGNRELKRIRAVAG